MSIICATERPEIAQPATAGPRIDGIVHENLGWYHPVKRVADAVVAIGLLVATAPMILVLLGLVKLTSPGPGLFSQVRLGRDGRPYRLYKIRTMTHDCERTTGPQWSTLKDSRVTPLGRFLRKSHLDELPQLWNVARGEMSLIGPRPERPEFVVDLERVVPGYRRRLEVLPGITGLAQIQLPPDNDIDDVHRKVRCDLRYIQEMGPAIEVKILAGTAMKILGCSYRTTSLVLNLPGVVDRRPGGSVQVKRRSMGRWQST